MFTQESITRKISKMAFCILLSIAFFSLANGYIYAQKTQKQFPYKVKLADYDSAKVPLKIILANPKLTTTYPDCDIASYSISFEPDGGEYFGPFKVKGSAIPENQVNYLREFTNMNVRIFIDELHLNFNGKDSLVNPWMFKSIP